MLLRLRPQPQYLRAQRLKPTRSPHWRFELAVDFNMTRLDPDVRRDRWIKDLWIVHNRRLKPLNTLKQRLLRKAMRIWEANDKTRWELEARLLTGRTISDVAAAMHLRFSVVKA